MSFSPPCFSVPLTQNLLLLINFLLFLLACIVILLEFTFYYLIILLLFTIYFGLCKWFVSIYICVLPEILCPRSIWIVNWTSKQLHYKLVTLSTIPRQVSFTCSEFHSHWLSAHLCMYACFFFLILHLNYDKVWWWLCSHLFCFLLFVVLIWIRTVWLI